MIKKLEKRLSFIFICSIMSIFTMVFLLFINESIQSEKEDEMNYMSRMTTYLVLQLENSPDLQLDLKSAEQSYNFSLQLMETNDSIVYQSPSRSGYDLNTLISAYEQTQKKVLTEFSKTASNTQSSLSGTLTFSTPNGCSFYGIHSKIVTKDSKTMQLYVMKEATDAFTLFKRHMPFYASTWVIVFVVIIILSKLLIRIAMKPTENTLQSQKAFIASASHELKSPLAVIMSSAECIESDSTLSGDSRHHTKIIDSECMRMSKLVQDLLLLSSVDANTWSLNKSAIDVDTLLIYTYEKYEPLCKQKGILFKLDTPGELFPPLYADIDRIDQILSILIDNAMTYSSPKSEILLSTSVVKNALTFSIIDHGTGIKDKDKPFIYDRFFCADKSRTQKEHYGLGLSIAKELLEMHNGSIELSDTPGGGCTFRISFPL